MDAQKIIEEIKNSPDFDRETKERYIALLSQDDLTDEKIIDILDQFADEVEKEIEENFQEMGIVLDEADPEYKAKYEEMIKKMEQANEDYQKEMDQILTEISAVQKEANNKLDLLKAELLKEEIASS